MQLCGRSRIEAYLAETHTVVGYSGSPVFVYIPPFSMRPVTAGDIQQDSWHGPWLLGIDVGHLLHYQDVL